MQISYKLQDKFDLAIFIPSVLLIILGLVAIFSATYNQPFASGNFQKQLFSAVVSLIILFIIYFLPSNSLKGIALPAYLLSIFFLVLVLAMGRSVYGAKSWLNIGPLGFQPSEFAKIGVIFLMSRWLTDKKEDINNIKDIGIALVIGFLPVVLILLEPDLGTAIVFVIITISILFWGGISLFAIFVVLSPGIVVFASLFGTVSFIVSLIFVFACLIFFKRNMFNSVTIFIMNLASGFFFDYIYKILKPHQQKRLETFLNPNADPLGAGYNALQAKVAIGSGGIFGKGYLQGNQTQLRFIPEQWTDFIYCVIGEEFGFIGSVFVIALFLILFLRLLKLASIAKDKYHALIIIGALSMFFAHFAINIGMNVGVTPVIGLPLPFLSYGGSSLMTNMILIGTVLNIYRNRKMHT